MSSRRLIQSEQLRSLALAAGEMGSWHWDAATGECAFDEGQCRIFGVEASHVRGDAAKRPLADPPGRPASAGSGARRGHAHRASPIRPSSASAAHRARSAGAAAPPSASSMTAGRLVRLSGVTADMTGHKEAEAHQALLTREVDHRARNALAVVQSIVRLTRAESMQELHRRGRGAHRGARPRACAPLPVALGGRRPRQARGGGNGAL